MTEQEKRETLDALKMRFYRAETAEEHAEICRLEAELLGGPWYDDEGEEQPLNAYVRDDGQFGIGA